MEFNKGEETPSPFENLTNGSTGATEGGNAILREPSPGGEDGSIASESGESETYEKRFQYYVAMLENPDPGNRWKAAESLARTGDDRAVDPLISALSDEDWRVRQKAAWALGYLGDPKAIPALRRAYRDDLDGVREMISEAIGMITMSATE
jgi:hypothetical protein